MKPHAPTNSSPRTSEARICDGHRLPCVGGGGSSGPPCLPQKTQTSEEGDQLPRSRRMSVKMLRLIPWICIFVTS